MSDLKVDSIAIASSFVGGAAASTQEMPTAYAEIIVTALSALFSGILVPMLRNWLSKRKGVKDEL